MFLGCIIQLIPFYASAQYLSGPVATSVGGAGRASLDPLEGAFLNPATLSQLNNYNMGVFFGDSHDLSSGEQRDLSFAISDSTPDKILPAAVAVTKRKITRSALPPVEQRDYYAAVADGVVTNLSMGIGFHRLESTIDSEKVVQNNLHLGFLFTPSENMGIALVAYDFLGADSDILSDIALRRTVALGFTHIFLDFFQVRLDWAMVIQANPDHKSKLMLGLESRLFEFFLLRMGAQRDELTGQTFVAVGSSFNGPRLALDYALQRELAPVDGGVRHLIDLRLKF